MATVRNVLAKYCEIKNERTAAPGPRLNQEQMWKVLEEDAEAYNGEVNLAEDEGGQPGHECGKFAPALFDLLLQELSRHPA